MLKGSKVTLRPIEKEDLKELLKIKCSQYVRDNVCGTFLGQNYDQMIDWFNAINTNNKDIRYSIIDNESSQVIGMVGLYSIDQYNNNAEFGIYLSKEGSGQGRGTEATNLIVDFGFNTINLKKIYLSVMAINERALKVYEKVGFIIEGKQKRHTFKNGKYEDIILMAKFKNE